MRTRTRRTCSICNREASHSKPHPWLCSVCDARLTASRPAIDFVDLTCSENARLTASREAIDLFEMDHEPPQLEALGRRPTTTATPAPTVPPTPTVLCNACDGTGFEANDWARPDPDPCDDCKGKGVR
jgi:hypothetical protein